MYDIFYIGDNQSLIEQLPFAQQVEDINAIKSNTSMYWLIEEDITITDYSIFDFKPDIHTKNYNHVWKWDQQNYGGVTLKVKKPKGFPETFHHNTVACTKTFNVLTSTTPGDYFETSSSTHVWCVDPEYKITENIDWAPGNFEPDFIHSFHLRGQLEHKYPAEEGGIKLYPRDWQGADIKYHGFLNADLDIPFMFVADIDDYAQRDIHTNDYVWLIDKEHKINTKTLDWVPNPFEKDFVHSFKMPYQLKEKYPLGMGGIRLVPMNWKEAELKIHPACPIEDEAYDVFFIDNEDFNAETYSEYADRSKTDWFWIVDREFQFNGKLLYVPASHELDYIHVFKIPEHLEERYPAEFTDPWDTRCGGIRLMNKNFDVTKHKYQEDICPVRYDIFYTDNISDYDTPARKSRTKMFWLVDNEHQINEEFNYVPQQHDQKYIHIFKFPNDLEHKYPKAITNISDNRAGGIKLVPRNGTSDSKYNATNPVGGRSYPIIYTDEILDTVDADCWILPTAFNDISHIPWSPTTFERNTKHIFNGVLTWMPKDWNGDVKVHDMSPVALTYEFETYSSYQEGLSKSIHAWFWVVDPDVDVIAGFDFSFQPDVFDDGKQHVWQKLNPITGKQYDYGGVSLRNKNEGKGRPKYIREPACTQKEYPVYHLQPEDMLQPLDDVYERLAKQTTTGMMWVVDAHVQVDDDFDYSYYPTQYDKDVVHIWQHKGNSKQSGVKLMPTGSYRLVDIKENSYSKLKELPKVVSKDPIWPVVQLKHMTSNEIQGILAEYSGVGYVWTVDPDVEINESIVQESIIPYVDNSNTVHVWKRTDADGLVIGHGGLRLWPTTYDAGVLSNEQVLTSSIPGQLILDAVAGEHKEYSICYLNSRSSLLEQINQFSNQCESSMFWVVDPHVELDENWKFDYVPSRWEESVVHIWQHKGNSKQSGVKLMPRSTYTQQEVRENSYIKLKEMNSIASKDPIWPVERLGTLTSAEVQQVINKHKDVGYVWTVDPDIELNDNIIKQSIIPYTDNSNVVHVWKRTDADGLVIGHGGLRLWPTDYDATQLTDDQVLTSSIPNQLILDAVAGEQKEYPVCYLNSNNSILEQINEFSIDCESNMFWVVDPHVELVDTWQFDYVPTRWEERVVHIWQHQGNSKQSGVKLMPVGTYTQQEVKDNSYIKLKEMYVVASKDPVWPVEQLNKLTSAEVQGIISKHQGVGYVWTVDPDIELDSDIITQSIIPHTDNSNIVHVWKRTDTDGLVIGHGGLRLWPTSYDASQLTDEQVLTCSIPEQLILDAVAGEQKEYPVCYLHNLNNIMEQLVQFESTLDSNMYWVVEPNSTLVSDWKFDYVPTKWEEHVVHVWIDSTDAQRGVRLIPAGTFTNTEYSIKQLINNSFKDLKTVYRVATTPTTWECFAFNTETPLLKQLEALKETSRGDYFYTIDPDVTPLPDFKYSYTPQLDGLCKTHAWQRSNPRTNKTHSYGGIRLWHKDIQGLTSDDIKLNKMPRGTLQYVKATASEYKPYHIVLITYKQDNYAELLSKLPEGTLLVKDVEGIFNAHQQASNAVDTSMFWVVDGDADVVDDFDFSYIPDVYDQDVTHVWNSTNPVTGDTYGYGGVKLFNTNQVRGATTWGIDFTTGLGKRFKVMPEVACTTRFNTDAYSTWRSAFRECVKLATSSDPDAQARLGAWLHPVPDAYFRSEAKLGAEMGNDYAGRNRGNTVALELINDYEWLEAQWTKLSDTSE